jgi:hypothetical protein
MHEMDAREGYAMRHTAIGIGDLAFSDLPMFYDCACLTRLYDTNPKGQKNPVHIVHHSLAKTSPDISSASTVTDHFRSRLGPTQIWKPTQLDFSIRP